MKGSYEVIVENERIQYKFTINRNITILRGDSATGKTTLIDMIYSYQSNGPESGVNLSCKRNCIAVDSASWKLIIQNTKESIIFIDEGNDFINTEEFASVLAKNDNYFVIATRNNLYNLPYSIKEIYGIKNTAGNRYQGTKRLYSTFYSLHDDKVDYIDRPEVVIVEDSNSGYMFFANFFSKMGIKCISAGGKSNIYNIVNKSNQNRLLVIADGAAFGSEINDIVALRSRKEIMIYLPESFEWMILKSGLIKFENMDDILNNTSQYVDSKKYISWERYFGKLLVEVTKDSNYFKYNKQKLNESYLQEKSQRKILAIMPEIKEN